MVDAVPIDRVVTENLVYGDENVVKETFAEQFVREYHPESENLNADSKKLTFELPGLPAKIFRPWSIVLKLPVKVTKEDGTNYTPPANTNPGTPTIHARFKNMAGLFIIKKVEVKPKTGADVENQQPELTGIRELLRFYFQQSEEEKNNRGLLYSNYISWPLHQAADSTICGTHNIDGTVQANADAYTLERLARTYHTLELKLPCAFMENASFIPSSLSFEVIITLASNAEMLITRRAANNGLGAVHGVANSDNAKYKIDHQNVRLVVTYKTLPDGKDGDGVK